MTDRLWRLTPHVCRKCLGRIVTSEDGSVSRCTNCGLEHAGDHSTVCCCGLKLRNGRPAGLHCKPNDKPTAELPSEIVASAV